MTVISCVHLPEYRPIPCIGYTTRWGVERSWLYHVDMIDNRLYDKQDCILVIDGFNVAWLTNEDGQTHRLGRMVVDTTPPEAGIDCTKICGVGYAFITK